MEGAPHLNAKKPGDCPRAAVAGLTKQPTSGFTGPGTEERIDDPPIKRISRTYSQNSRCSERQPRPDEANIDH